MKTPAPQNKADGKIQKPLRPASLYRKPIPEKEFEKNYVRQLGLPRDQSFLCACFDRQGAFMVLRDGLDRESVARLNTLAKSIKANRGAIKTAPLAGFLILVAAVVIFCLFFMNPLLERSAESALSSAFGARADISSLRFSPLTLRIRIAALSIADRDSPMKNLFEAGRLELRLNPGEALRGRIYIEEAAAMSIAFGTPRQTSGALAREPESKPQEATPGPALVDVSAFDAKALLEREKNSLESTAAYAASGKAYAEAADRWKERYSASAKAVGDVEASGKKLLSLDVSSLSTPSEVAAALKEIQALGSAVQTVGTEARAVSTGIRSDWEETAALEKRAVDSVKKDGAYLASFIQIGSGTARSALSPSLRKIISVSAATYLHYGEMALCAAQKLKSGDASPRTKKVKAVAFTGRTVEFPSASGPRFRLGLLQSSFHDGKRSWAVQIAEISSNPDLVGAPSMLNVTVREGNTSLSCKAVADLRDSSPEAFLVEASGSSIPFNLGSSLEGLGMSSSSGRASFSLRFSGMKEGSLSASSDIQVREGTFTPKDPSSPIYSSIASSVKSLEVIRLGVKYTKTLSGDDFSVSSNLDDLFSKALSDVATAYTAKARRDLEAALSDYVGKELSGKLSAKADLAELSSSSLGDEKSMAEMRKALDGKAGELEARARKLGAGKIKSLGVPKIKL